jgi:orotate phosphoribosyltransferase
MTDAKMRLLELVKKRSLIFGEITLASGQKSNYYIDGKMSLMYSETAPLIGEVLFEMTKDMNLDALGGPEVGAIPMATAAAIRYQQAGRPIEGFFVRKEAKQHGTQKLIEGGFRAGQRVAILEDVITTGGSVFQSIDAVQTAGGKIEAVICLVDRLQGARERFEARGLRFLPVFTIRDLGIA